MKKNTKKKVLTLTLVILLLSIAIVGGSLAWFTAEDEATNVFTVGSIKIVQHEQQRNKETGELERFDQKKTLMPIVNTSNPAADENYEDKIVTVENIGKNEAYVRTHIAIPSALVGYLHTDVNLTDGWEKESETGYQVVVEDVEYTVSYYRYNKVLTTEGTEATTTQLLKGVYMDSAVDVKDNPGTLQEDIQFCILNDDGTYSYSEYMVKDNTEIKVLVATQAVQADGFNGNVGNALYNAFGTPTATSNPFVN